MQFMNLMGHMHPMDRVEFIRWVGWHWPEEQEDKVVLLNKWLEEQWKRHNDEKPWKKLTWPQILGRKLLKDVASAWGRGTAILD